MRAVNSLSKKRGEYYRHIFEYKKRREKYRLELEEHKIVYRDKTAKLSKKIKLWGREIKRIDERALKIKLLIRAVYLFTGYNVKRPLENKVSKEVVQLARGLYYKYGLEHKMQGKELRENIFIGRIQQPTEYRRWMTNEIVTNSLMKQKWENFKEYMKNH